MTKKYNLLSTAKTQPLLNKTFGNDTDHETTCDSVRFTMESINGDSVTDIAAFVVPNNCSGLVSQEIDRAKECFAHLSGIDLADNHCGDTPMDIDLLLGANHMWQFLQDRRNGRGRGEKSGRGSIASKAILGWVKSWQNQNHCCLMLISPPHTFFELEQKSQKHGQQMNFFMV